MHAGEAHGLPQCRVRRSRAERPRVPGLLKDDHITGAQLDGPLRRAVLAARRRAVHQHGAGRSRGEVAVGLAPAPQTDDVVDGQQFRDRFQTAQAGLGGQRGVLLQGGQQAGRDRARVEHRRSLAHPGARRGEADLAEREGDRRRHVQAHPRPGVAAFVQAIAGQPGVPVNRNPVAGGLQVGLGRHGVLVVAQVVADVGQQLDQRDPDVGLVLLGPVRHRHREPVEHQLPQPGVVPVDVGHLVIGGGRAGGRPHDRRPRRVDVEHEAHLSETRVDATMRPPAGGAVRPALDDPEQVRGRSGVVKLDDQAILDLRLGLLRAAQLDRSHGASAVRGVDPDVAGVQPAGHVREEVDKQPPATLSHLDPVEAVAVTLAQLVPPGIADDHQIAPAHLAAHNPPGTVRVRAAGELVASTV